MKIIKKIIISALVLLTMPILTNAKTYQFEIKTNNLSVNSVTGTFDIKYGKIINIQMAKDWENKTGLNNNFYFSTSKTKTGSSLIATVTIEGTEQSYYQIIDLTYHNLKCEQDKYGSYYNNDGTKVSAEDYKKSCLDNNTYLKSLSLSKGTLSPEFNKNTNQYTVEVESDVTYVKIDAVPESSTSKITSSNTCNLKEGKNTCNVVVKAQDDSFKIYTITITRKYKDNKTSVFKITDFKVINADLQEEFNQSVKNYNLKLHENQKEIYFKFNQDGIEYTSKPCDVSKGTTICLLTVPSLDQSATITYTFNILDNTPVIANPVSSNSSSVNTGTNSNNNQNQVEENNNENNIPELPNKQEEPEQEEIVVNSVAKKPKITVLKVLAIFATGAVIGVVVYFVIKKIFRRHKFFV